ncbi:hypothetical protein FKP32DRAFT_1562162 [Trametes sanguinea]|nr:hypothetical protein FKP32DRAFT_1562162 [Trametes sanguinea]
MVHANEDAVSQDLPQSDSTGKTTAQEPVLYWYAQVLGIYHVNVLEDITASSGSRPQPRRFDFLHIRWFGRDPDWESGWAAKRLERIGFVPESDEGAFDFLDPADVIRGCHLIPAFAEGRTRSLLGRSMLARPASGANDDSDWERYYVNRFVDRDMFMRYLGGAVGHGTPLVPYVSELCGAQPEEPAEDAMTSDGEYTSFRAYYA